MSNKTFPTPRRERFQATEDIGRLRLSETRLRQLRSELDLVFFFRVIPIMSFFVRIVLSGGFALSEAIDRRFYQLLRQVAEIVTCTGCAFGKQTGFSKPRKGVDLQKM